jgi:23S rRNA (uracil1939-C5)-methyltransferase
VEAEHLTSDGTAVGFHDGRHVLVPFAAPGDVLDVEVDADEAGVVEGKILRLVKPSPHRVDPGCPHFETCGGCQWLHVSYEHQCQAKEKTFFLLEGIDPASVRAKHIAPTPLLAGIHYRNRAKLHVTGHPAGVSAPRTIPATASNGLAAAFLDGRIGFAGAGTREIVEVRECRVLAPALERALLALRAAFQELGPVPECSDVTLACDRLGDSVAAAFHVKRVKKGAPQRVEAVMRRAKLKGAVLAPEEGAAREIGRPVLSYGLPFLSGVPLYIRPDVFFQANLTTNSDLVFEAVKLLGPQREVLELFGGNGNFTFAIEGTGAKVTSIERDSRALELARRSAREAGIRTVRFHLGDAMKIARALAEEGYRFDAVFLDPPRAGAAGIGQLARAVGASRVVYVSCDMKSLARDLRELCSCGYRPVAAIPVDMFPQTPHVEAVVCLDPI